MFVSGTSSEMTIIVKINKLLNSLILLGFFCISSYSFKASKYLEHYIMTSFVGWQPDLDVINGGRSQNATSLTYNTAQVATV